MKSVVGQFVNAQGFIKEVMTEIYAEDRKLRMQAAQHVKRKIAAKISDEYFEGFHSQPGEPPGKITGNLLKGLKIENKRTVALVGFGPPAYHAHLLEFGTKNMKPRPFLFSTFAEEAASVEKILSGQRLKD